MARMGFSENHKYHEKEVHYRVIEGLANKTSIKFGFLLRPNLPWRERRRQIRGSLMV